MRLRSGSRGSSAAALACVLTLALTGCPSKKPQSKPTSQVSPARPSGTRGGELVVAYPAEPATLNPYLPGGDAPSVRDVIRPLMPSLWRTGPGGVRERSLLAEDPVTAESGGQFLAGVRLRDDANWSDGTPITTKDLRYTWQYITNLRYPSIRRAAYRRVTDVRIQTDHSATLVFAHPYAAWKDLFSGGDGILPAHVLMKSNLSTALSGAWPVSGGPFVLKSWTRGLEMVFERNPTYWGDEPYLDRIRVQFVPDVVTAFALLSAGRVQALGPYTAVDFARRGALVSGARVTSDFGSTWVGIVLNLRVAVLSDARVRRALAYAIDRAAINEGLVREEGRALNALSDGTDVPDTAAFSSYRSNVATAADLLSTAGWKGSGIRSRNGKDLTFTLASSPSDLADRIVRALHAQAERAGIDVNSVTIDDDELWRDWMRGNRFQAALVVLRDEPGGNVLDRFGPRLPANLSHLSGVDQLLEAAFAGAVFNAAAVGALENRLAELVPVIPLYEERVTIVAGKGVKNLRANGTSAGFLWNCSDWSKA